MRKYNYDSYCGIYCGACDIHLAYETGQKDRFASFFTIPTLEALLTARGVLYRQSELELKCHGCKSDMLFINCSDCPIRSCAVGKQVDHCIDCVDYPCAIHRGRTKMEGLLPHLTSNYANMETIGKAGLETWLLEQDEKWKCPDCQTRFGWYASHCATCGRDLKNRTFKFPRIKAALLKAGIYVSAFVKILHPRR